MLAETLEKGWRERQGAGPLAPALAFGPDGLTLGAGTVLAATDDDERNIALDEAAEARLQALLAAAYVRPVSAQTLRYIRRGAASWREGDKAMAAMHLAMTGLTPLREPKAAARRLFMADQLMKAGATPDVIFRALDLEPPLTKAALSIGDYNPLEPAQPAGRVGPCRRGRCRRRRIAQPSASPWNSLMARSRITAARPSATLSKVRATRATKALQFRCPPSTPRSTRTNPNCARRRDPTSLAAARAVQADCLRTG